MRSDFHRDPTFFSVVGAPYVAERHRVERTARRVRARAHVQAQEPGRLEFGVLTWAVALIALALASAAHAIHHVF